jgi:AraC-like DNA-binding protein
MTENTAAPTPVVEEQELSKRLTPREYARAKTMWQSGDYSLKEISDAVGVSATALSRRFKRDSVSKGSDAKKVSAAVKRAIEKTSAAQAEELATAAHDIKMLALKSIELFNKKGYSDVAKCIRDNRPLAEIQGDLKALKIASEIVSMNYGTGARILGLDKDLNIDDTLPELQITLMTENDVADLREQQRREEAEANGEIDDEDLLGTELSADDLDALDEALDKEAAEEDEIVVEGDEPAVS